MGFKSVLSGIGHELAKVFTVATKVAVAAEPIVDIALPGISGLYNATVAEVAKAEGMAIAAGQQDGTGAQKLALVVAAIEKEFESFAKTNNITFDATHVEAWVNAVVASLNAIPAAEGA
jgi:hypothetical protein